MRHFMASPCAFVAGVTDAQTGEPVYFGKEDMQGDCTVLRASSSIPCFAPAVTYKGKEYLDGGTSDPIPVRKALEDGCDRVVVVLTRGAGICQEAGAGPGGLPPCFPASAGDDSGAGSAP